MALLPSKSSITHGFTDFKLFIFRNILILISNVVLPNAMNRINRRNAQFAVQDALKSGQLVKPKNCSKCGVYNKYIDGHHDDYSKKLDVVWLCRSCHQKIHKKKKKPIYSSELSESIKLRLLKRQKRSRVVYLRITNKTKEILLGLSNRSGTRMSDLINEAIYSYFNIDSDK